jgi:hypothetical protein
LETSVRSATDLTIRLALSAFVLGLVRLVVGRNIAARPRAPIHAGEGPARRGARSGSGELLGEELELFADHLVQIGDVGLGLARGFLGRFGATDRVFHLLPRKR